jgi:hypothetical protein
MKSKKEKEFIGRSKSIEGEEAGNDLLVLPWLPRTLLMLKSKASLHFIQHCWVRVVRLTVTVGWGKGTDLICL